MKRTQASAIIAVLLVLSALIVACDKKDGPTSGEKTASAKTTAAIADLRGLVKEMCACRKQKDPLCPVNVNEKFVKLELGDAPAAERDPLLKQFTNCMSGRDPNWTDPDANKPLSAEAKAKFRKRMCEKLCKWQGRCTLGEDSKCFASSDSECKLSSVCKQMGACTAKDGRCRITNSTGCSQASVCTDNGKCTFDDGECRATSDTDCRKSTDCKNYRQCAVKDGKCVK
jgi:major membrane immunogen (membrane-anchored lipoprotein)